MAVSFKQKCSKCRKNYTLTTSRNGFPVCEECQGKEMKGEIKDPEMKKLLDIPEDFYSKSSFLRSIKVNYLRYEKLSEKQIEAFKSTVKKMNENLKKK